MGRPNILKYTTSPVHPFVQMLNETHELRGENDSTEDPSPLSEA